MLVHLFFALQSTLNFPAKLSHLSWHKGHIFISYSHKDSEYVGLLAQELRSRKYPIWRDIYDLLPGDGWMNGITKAITDCKVFIIVMSPSSSVSDWVYKEIAIADRFKKPIVPLLLMGEAIPVLLSTQYEDVTNGKLPSQQFYRKLNQYFDTQSNKLSPEEEIEALRQQVASLQALVDETSRPQPIQYDAEVSNDIREDIRLRLIDLARRGETIEYKQLAQEVGLRKDHDPHRTIPRIIGSISVTEDQAGRPLLSVLVVGKDSKIPGDGFYKLARYLKPQYRTLDDLAILTKEMNAAFAYWQAQSG